MRIGVLALQGAFREHREMLAYLGVEATEIRQPEDLHGCDGLVLPGGETTAQRKLAQTYGLWEPLERLGRQGIPILATCAGLILLAKRIDGKTGSSLDLLDVDVQRNAYGRQVFSFETSLPIPRLAGILDGPKSFRAIFIRAPRIVRAGEGVSVLGSHQGEPVAVEQGSILGVSFHPELTDDPRFHTYFLEAVRRHKGAPTGEKAAAETTSLLRAAVGDETLTGRQRDHSFRK
jgi:pyridoxal 5'-phosphate synthase pdxT subunit